MSRSDEDELVDFFRTMHRDHGRDMAMSMAKRWIMEWEADGKAALAQNMRVRLRHLFTQLKRKK